MPVRILYVHNSADIYGASRSLLRLLRVIDRHKFEPLVLLPVDGPLKAELERRGVEVIIDSGLSIVTRATSRARLLTRFFPSVFRMRRLLKEKKIGIVHTNTGVIFSPCLAAKLAGVPHVWHVRDWFGEFRGMWTAYSAYIRLFSDKIIAVSGPIAKQFKHREKVVVIHNGFALEEFAVDRPVLREAFRKKFQIGVDEIVVSCVGRIKLVRKGQEILLEAAALLKKRGRNAKYLFAGSPAIGNENHLQTLKAQAKKLGLETDVIFAGELPDTLPVYAASDIFVLPSAQPEPFGGVVMEAMAMGLPVIATAIGGSLEQVEEGVTGFLVPPADATALADKLGLLIEQPEMRDRLGHAGPERIAQHFNIDRMVRKIEGVYDEISSNPAAEVERILYVHNGADVYGASRCLARLLAYLDKDKFKATVVLPEDGPLKRMLEDIGIEVIIHPRMSVITRPIFRSWRLIGFALRFPISVLFLLRTVRKKKITLVHTNTGVIISPALAAWLAGVRHVWHVRDWFGEFKPVWRFYSSYIMALSDKILNVSNPISRQFKTSPKNIVVHDGFSVAEFPIDQSLLRTTFRHHFGPAEEPVIGCVGRIKFKRKGQEILVRAAAILKQRGVRANYLVVGAPFPGNEDHLARLKDLIRTLDLEKEVVLTGELNDVRGAYAAMDIFALTSAQPEPFGGVVLEAMAMERPVVATNIGGSVDQVLDGVTGFLVPPSDPEALADKLQILLADPELQRRMGVAGRERVKTEFPVERMVRETEAVYDELLASKP